MEKNYPNKQVKTEDIKTKKFSFPEWGISVQASNLEEAEKKAREIMGEHNQVKKSEVVDD